MDTPHGETHVESLEKFFRVSNLEIHNHDIEGQIVINLSTIFVPSREQLQLLNKGLTFIPSRDEGGRARAPLMADLTEYHRRLKLASYFGPTKVPLRKPFKKPSHWEPTQEKLPRELFELIKQDRKTIKEIRYMEEDYNMTSGELQGLRELQDMKTIVIKPADKGAAIVIMDRTCYVQEAHRQLRDLKYYEPLTKPMFPETATQITEILFSLQQKKYLSKAQVAYLQGEHPHRARRFYLLPKIHKPRDNWTLPNRMPPGRPIVSDCGSESYRVAEFLDFHLNPLSVHHPSYLKDTMDFVRKIRNITVTEPCYLFTMDVNSLYTNIDTQLGLKAVSECLKRHPKEDRPDAEILQLLELCLIRNDFTFNGQFYLQTKGTAMGKKFAPSYANIYMAAWEEEAFRKCTKRPILYVRFLDDIFGLWTYDRAEFIHFVGILNGHHDLITVEPKLEELEINFLDTTVYKDDKTKETGRLYTKVYFKPTDTHALLHKESHHPKHTFKGIIKSQLLRFDRICSQKEDREQATRILFRSLRKRGYSRSFLRYVVKDTFKTRDANMTRESPQQMIPLISTYSKYTVGAHHLLKRNFEQRFKNTTFGQTFKVISAFRRGRNLKDYLVRAELKSSVDGLKGKRPLSVVKNRWERTAFRIPSGITWKVHNCIYLIQCGRCGIQYVGETRNSLRTRLSHHRYNVNRGHKRNTHLVKHFQRHGVRFLNLLGLQHDPSWTTSQRRKEEGKWIRKLNSTFPNGLNEKT